METDFLGRWTADGAELSFAADGTMTYTPPDGAMTGTFYVITTSSQYPAGSVLFELSAESNTPDFWGIFTLTVTGDTPDRRQCHRGSVAGSADHNLFRKQADVHQYAQFPAPSHRCRELFVWKLRARSAAIPWEPSGKPVGKTGRRAWGRRGCPRRRF